VNEYKPPETLVREVHVEEMDEPGSETYDITLINNALVVGGSEQSEFGQDWRLDSNTVGSFEGRDYADYGFARVTHENQEVTWPDDAEDPAEYGEIIIRENVVDTCMLLSFFNVNAWERGNNNCGLNANAETYDHSIEHHNRVLDLSLLPGRAKPPPGYNRPHTYYSEDAALTLDGGINYINIDLTDQAAYGWFEMYPYNQRTFVIDADQLEAPEDADVENEDEPVATDRTLSVGLLDAFDPITISAELQNRTYEFVGTYEFEYGNNDPMIHYEREVEPDGLDAALHSTETGWAERGRTEHWLAFDPQEPPIEGSDQLLINPRFFYEKMRVENEYQAFYPMGRDTLLTARPKVMQE
jgi:hypothetical protein